MASLRPEADVLQEEWEIEYNAGKGLFLPPGSARILLEKSREGALGLIGLLFTAGCGGSLPTPPPEETYVNSILATLSGPSQIQQRSPLTLTPSIQLYDQDGNPLTMGPDSVVGFEGGTSAANRIGKVTGGSWQVPNSLVNEPGSLNLWIEAYKTNKEGRLVTGRDNHNVDVTEDEPEVTTLEGRIVNSLTDQGTRAKLTLYSTTDPNNPLQVINTDANGSFSDELDTDLENYLVTAELLDGSGQTTSFIYTNPNFQVNQGQNNNAGTIQVFPAEWLLELGYSKLKDAMEDWRTHTNDLNFSANTDANSVGYSESMGINPDDIDVVYIFNTHRETRNGVAKGSFGEYQATVQDIVRQHIEMLFPNSNLMNNIVMGNDSDTDFPATIDGDGFVVPNQGAIIYVPDTTMAFPGITAPIDDDKDGWLDRAKVLINVNEALEIGEGNLRYVIGHETNHWSSPAVGHTTVFTTSQSINRPGESNSRSHLPLLVDIKYSKMMQIYGGRKELDNVLRMPNQ